MPPRWRPPPPGLVPLALAAGTSARISRRVDRVLVHTVSATGLTAVVVAVYLVIVIGLGRTPDDTERNLLVLSMLAAAVASLAYVPARERLAETANRLVYGERHPPDEVLRTWGSRLSRSIPMDELLLQLAESLRKMLRAAPGRGLDRHARARSSWPCRCPTAPRRALHLGPEEQPVVTRAGVTGNAWLEVWLPALLEDRPPSQLRVAPASHSGELLGLLVVERAADGDHFTEEDDRVLTELARQVGLALHNVQLDSALQESLENLKRANEDLRASRARIVATGDAERRKIERNLHDGAQQHLVALAVNLRLTKDILADDPEAAAEMLDALGDAVKDTIQELRDLAHGIYPPLLMDAGLAEALRAAANRSPLAVERGRRRHRPLLHRGRGGRVLLLPRGAAERRQARARRVRVDRPAARPTASLRFTVRDDGPGFDVAAATAGHGYVNMSDRLGAIGGTVRVAIRARRRSRDLRHHPAAVTDDEPQPDDDRAGPRRTRRRDRPLGDPVALAGPRAHRPARRRGGRRRHQRHRVWPAAPPRPTTASARPPRSTMPAARCCATPSWPTRSSTLPAVTESWLGGIGVAKIEGENTFIGITAGPREPSEIIKPIVLEGRLPQASPDPEVIEIVLREDFQREVDVPIGTEFPVRFLAEEDYFRFDTGFEGGEVHGPEAVLEVVGTVRLAGGFSTDAARPSRAGPRSSRTPRRSSARATSSASRRAPPGSTAFHALPRTWSATASFRPRPPSSPWSTSSTRRSTEAAVDNTAILLGRALMIFALVDGGGRWHRDRPGPRPAPHRHRPRPRGRAGAGADAGAADRPPGSCRACSPPALATILATIGALAAARIEPIGAIHLYEPHPGPAVNVAVLAVGIVAVFVGVLAAAGPHRRVPPIAPNRCGGAGELGREPGHPRRGLAPDGPRPPVRAGGGPGRARRAGALRDHRRDGRAWPASSPAWCSSPASIG